MQYLKGVFEHPSLVYHWLMSWSVSKLLEEHLLVYVAQYYPRHGGTGDILRGWRMTWPVGHQVKG